MANRTRHIVLVIGLIVLLVMLTVLDSFQHDFSQDGNTLDETGWRYNSSIHDLGEGILVSTRDKLTGISTTRIFAPGKEKPVRTMITIKKLDWMIILDEDRQIVYKGKCSG
ncbi:MAG: hypothetical protein IJA84_05645 [Clostridia bacterium]|nr:hypothetical protein [Clostridia bacterium]